MILFPEGDESGKNIRILIGFPRGLKPQHGWFTSLPSNIAKVVGLKRCCRPIDPFDGDLRCLKQMKTSRQSKYPVLI